MANTFRNNPKWDVTIQKDIKCSVKSRDKMNPDWIYAFGDAYCSIVRKGDKYGIVARADKKDEYTGVCACKYDSIHLLYMLDEYQECNYAYFAVMKSGKYGVFRVESSNEISEKLYGREVVSCKYDQIGPINTEQSALNIILLMNNRIETDQYNREREYIEMSYYNGFTDNVSDTYRGIASMDNHLECYKLYERGYLINLYNDSLIHKSLKHIYYMPLGKTKIWKIFKEKTTAKDRLIFYNVQERETFTIENLGKIRNFCGEDDFDRIAAYKEKEYIEIKLDDIEIANAINAYAEGPEKF